MPQRHNRTWLFVAGTDDRRMGKAEAGDADALILDLEDAVAIAEKPRARHLIRDFLATRSPDRQIYVRVNDLTTGETTADIAAICAPGLAGIVLPKVEDAGALRAASAMIDRFERDAGLPGGQVRLNAIIETARGIVNANTIAAEGSERLDTLMFGAGDYTADLGIPTANVGPHLLHGKVVTAVACRAAGLMAPIDTVYFDLKNPEGLLADCREAKELGFMGKAVIHPSQVETANTVFTPTPDELAAAQRIVDGFREAEAAGKGAVQIDGKLVDYAMLKSAEKILMLGR